MVDISIKKKYGNFKLNIQFSSESRRIGILGRSGSGKSLTLKSIAGIERPDNGYINIDGNILFDKKSNRNIKTQKRHTGYMFQNYALFPAMTVEKNIMSVIKGSKKHREEMTLKLINQLGLKDVKNSLPSKLSGGQQQRCAMARIFASQPDTILLDEPFSALDIYIKDKMENELTDIIKDFKGTVILVSHNIDEIYRICDHTVVIDNGMVSAEGRTSEIFKNPGTVSAAILTGCKNIGYVNKGYIHNWGITLPIKTENIKAVGIREYEFSTEKKEISFDVYDPQVREDANEYNIIFKASENAEETINWKVSKYNMDFDINNIPHKAYIDKSAILPLTERR